MKISLSYIVLCIHVCTARSVKTNNNLLRIIGGRNATPDEFPYVVKLMVQSLAVRTQDNIFLCSSAVLTSKWTLTAGHCIMGIGQVMIAIGVQCKAVIEYRPTPKAEVAYSEVISTIIHPNFRLQVLKNDIGLLHTQPVLFSQYGKLSPIDYDTLNGQQVSIVGYGMMKNLAEDQPLLPQVLEVVVKYCYNRHLYPQICFASACSLHVHDVKAMCNGDSGGPGIHASGIVSINSVTDIRNCGLDPGASLRRDRYDKGYEIGTGTAVSPYIDWISSVMKSDLP